MWVSAFGTYTGLLSHAYPIYRKNPARGSSISKYYRDSPVFGQPPSWLSTRPQPHGSQNSDGGRWFITVKGGNMKVYSPGFRETYWTKGTGPVSLGWRPADFWPTSVDVLAVKANPWTQSRLVFEKNGFDSVTGKQLFNAFIERGEARLEPKQSYVTQHLLLATNELQFIKSLHSRHAAELAAILKLRNELKKVPQTGTTTLIGLAGMTNYTEASLRSALNLLYNSPWKDKTRISPPGLTIAIQSILYDR